MREHVRPRRCSERPSQPSLHASRARVRSWGLASKKEMSSVGSCVDGPVRSHELPREPRRNAGAPARVCAVPRSQLGDWGRWRCWSSSSKCVARRGVQAQRQASPCVCVHRRLRTAQGCGPVRRRQSVLDQYDDRSHRPDGASIRHLSTQPVRLLSHHTAYLRSPARQRQPRSKQCGGWWVVPL